MNTLIKWTFAGLIIVAGTFFGYRHWQHNIEYPKTDNAYLQANVLHIAPQITGTVLELKVKNNQLVKKGALLFKVDPSAFQLAVVKAHAHLDETLKQVKAAQLALAAAQSRVEEREAELTNTEKDANRTLVLVKKKLYPATAGDKATRQLKVAKAALEAARSQVQEAKAKLGKLGDKNAGVRSARATLAQTELDLDHTIVRAPCAGHIAHLTLRQGDQVTANQPTFMIIELQHWWLDANFKETQLQRIRPGQRAEIVIDMYPNHVFKGTVESISPGSGTAFSLLPAENATGNWIKVTQRVPVRVRIDDIDPKFPLRIGLSATVTIDTTALPKA